MPKHILDRPDGPVGDAPVSRYARAARAQESQEQADRRLMMLRRRAKGPWNPAARMRAFLRIERGYEA